MGSQWSGRSTSARHLRPRPSPLSRSSRCTRESPGYSPRNPHPAFPSRTTPSTFPPAPSCTRTRAGTPTSSTKRAPENAVYVPHRSSYPPSHPSPVHELPEHFYNLGTPHINANKTLPPLLLLNLWLLLLLFTPSYALDSAGHPRRTRDSPLPSSR
ncbi:hypothetical protein FIBSPDRAFT_276711 [Athelia psychrophila]|uniref:Uncharacterized protein n=1 Tax=Athelia psychrophila TaxID=1759441 RepID=A0A165WR11_9AGAM|nr:hypothetical protein FIBSPDRAFT_276711 [Fibularhizoctonia sp. CBS 109695]